MFSLTDTAGPWRFKEMGTSCRLFVSSWLVLGISSLAFADDESARAQFLKQYRPRFSAIHDYYTNVDFAFTSKSYHKNGVIQIEHTKGKYTRSNCLLRGETKMVHPTGKVVAYRGSIECLNARYSFSLHSISDDDFILDALKLHTASNKPIFCQLSVPYEDRWMKQTYLEIAQDEKKEIVAFEDCTWDNKPMKELKCKLISINSVSKKPIATIHCYYFSPADDWICRGHRSYSADVVNPDIDESLYSYERREGEPFPVLKRIDEWEKKFQEPAKPRHRYEIEITEFHHSPVPFSDSDFTLTAFGLPEPVGIKPPAPSRTWLWLLAATIGAGLLAVLFVQLKRRAAKMAKVEPPAP